MPQSEHRIFFDTVKQSLWFNGRSNMNEWVTAHYGTRRGFIESKRHQLLYYFGYYHRYTVVPWNDVKRLVFVCSGNICRSAFAEVVAKTVGFSAISAGVHAIEGVQANDQAIRTAQAMGYDLTLHRTTPIVYSNLKKSDLLVAMEPWQAAIVKNSLSRNHYTTLLGMWIKPKRLHLPDPYMRSDAYFNHCFNYIEKSVHAIIADIRKAD